MMKTGVAILALCLCGVASAQTSPSYRLEEYALNAGGRPEGGAVLLSASFRLSIVSVGDGPVAPVLASATLSMEAGFARSYPPPGEVCDVVVFKDKETFAWDPEASVGAYEVYRGGFDSLPFAYGTCRLSELPVAAAILDDVPDAGQGFFYLVTARNRLSEEGTKGSTSAGVPRSNAFPCP